jgi:hypothetical protein
MGWFARHGWWGLFAVALIFVAFGVTDMASGAAADPAIALGLTGQSLEQLEAESAAAYGLYDFVSRSQGWSLVLLGVLIAVIVLIPFRRGERWAWWTAWALPVWAAGVPIIYLVAGLAPDQPPPPPMISGPIVAMLCAAILVLSRPRVAVSASA